MIKENVDYFPECLSLMRSAYAFAECSFNSYEGALKSKTAMDFSTKNIAFAEIVQGDATLTFVKISVREMGRKTV